MVVRSGQYTKPDSRLTERGAAVCRELSRDGYRLVVGLRFSDCRQVEAWPFVVSSADPRLV